MKFVGYKRPYFSWKYKNVFEFQATPEYNLGLIETISIKSIQCRELTYKNYGSNHPNISTKMSFLLRYLRIL